MQDQTLATSLIPARATLRIGFAHQAYDVKPLFDALETGVEAVQVRTHDEVRDILPSVDVLVISGLWKNDLLPYAGRLRYLQSFSSGTNQYDLDMFSRRGIFLSNGQGVNKNAVSEHAMGLLLSLTRRLALARDNQHRAFWRAEQTDPMQREDELPGKTMLIVGTGVIGDRIARLAKAFDMRVIGVRRDPARGQGAADEMHSFHQLKSLIPQADVVVLSCPLTSETANLMDAAAIALMKPTAYFINVARGGCVDEAALIRALENNDIAGAGLDVMAVEPLPESSPLWGMENVIVTPHTAGETRRYEQNILSILTQNLDRLWSGNSDLLNRIV